MIHHLRFLRTALALERNVLVISTTLFLSMTSLFAWNLLLPLYFRDLGASNAQVGLAYSLLTLSLALMQIVGGFLSDRYGRKLPIVLSTFALALLYALAGTTHSWEVLLVIMLGANSLGAIQWPAFMALTAESVSEDRRGRAIGMLEFANILGTTVGPALGAALLPVLGLKFLLYSTALVRLLCFGLQALGLHEIAIHCTPQRNKASIRRQFNAKLVSLLAVASLFALFFTLTLYGPFVSLHAEDFLRLTKPKINLLFSVGGLSAVAVSLVGGRLTDRLGSRHTMMFGSVIHALAMVFWALSRASLASLASFAVANAGLQVSVVAYETLLVHTSPQDSRGTIVGLFGTISGVISAAAPAAGAYLRDSFASAAPFWAALVVGVIMIICLFRFDDGTEAQIAST